VTLTSFAFLFYVTLAIIIYYVIPQRLQWTALLCYSAVFFALSGNVTTGIYLLITWITTYVAGRGMAATENERYRKLWFTFGIGINLGILFLLKYLNFAIRNVNKVMIATGHSEIPFSTLLAPIAISFYSLVCFGYLIEVYWGSIEPAQNFGKLGLFLFYFPQMTSGPITRYGQMEPQISGAHAFDSKNITFGVERILWGMFKKLVVSARVSGWVHTLYYTPDTFHGLYYWLAAFLFMLYLYADFSGCMDIIMGVSECFGIMLPENFERPFFARSVQEYWQKWHATLGAWLKDYILYPILRSKMFMNMGKKLRKAGYKHAAKRVPSYLGMLCVWLLIGLWHGGDWKYILGMGMWFFGCIFLAQVLEPARKKLAEALHIKRDSLPWHVVQSLGVFVLVSIGNMFFYLDGIRHVLANLLDMFTTWNPGDFDGRFATTGATHQDIWLIVIFVLLQFAVSLYQECKGSVRECVLSMPFIVRYVIWLGLFLGVFYFGKYGPNINLADFIYRGF